MNDIVRYEATPIDTERLGDILVKSGFFKDVKDQAQAIVKMLYGGELGFGPIASMMGVYVVEGRPSMSAQLIAAAIQRSGTFNYRVREWTDDKCRIEFFERGEAVGFAEFTMKDAERANLAKKLNWATFPKAMLWARAMSQGARAYCPSIFNGAIYSVEELHDGLTETTDIETGEVTVVEVPPSEPPDMVRNADERIWKNWLRVLAKAQGLGLNPQLVTLPIDRGDLKALGSQVLLDIQSREEMLAEADGVREEAGGGAVTSSLVVVGRDIESITDDIHNVQQNARRMVLEHALHIGQLLLEARPLFVGDEQGYLSWAHDEFGYSRSRVFRLMQLTEVSRGRPLPPDTSIRQALATLLPPSSESEPKPLPEPGSTELEPMPLLRFCQADLPTAVIIALILRVAFPDARRALDMTYGSGAFWDGSADVEVTAHDADPARALDGVADFTHLAYANESFDVALFDPPHIADAGAESIMGQRFGTYADGDLPGVIAAGTREAWRVARLGIIVKVADHVHGQEFVSEVDWVRDALGGRKPYDVVHQVRSGALVDPKWEEQLSAYNNGASYLIFRKGVQKHVRRRNRDA